MGILTEDRYKEPLRILVSKLGISSRIISLRGGGNLFNPAKVHAHTELLLSNRRISKVLAVVDGNCNVPEVRTHARQMEKALAELGLRVHARYFVVEHELESWLLSSPEALSAVGLKLPRRSVPDLHDAKGFLRALYERAGKLYMQSREGVRLAQGVDVGTLASRYANFHAFAEEFEDP